MHTFPYLFQKPNRRCFLFILNWLLSLVLVRLRCLVFVAVQVAPPVLVAVSAWFPQNYPWQTFNKDPSWLQSFPGNLFVKCLLSLFFLLFVCSVCFIVFLFNSGEVGFRIS